MKIFLLNTILVLIVLTLLFLIIFMASVLYSCAKEDFPDLFEDLKKWRNRRK